MAALLNSLEVELAAQILAAPDDDAPRLVLADALLERGHALGELIRLSLDPRGDWLRERELEAHLSRELLATEYPWATDLVFERGLPAAAAVDPLKFSRAEPAPPFLLRSLEFHGGSLGHFKDAILSAQGQAVEHVDLSRVTIDQRFTMFVGGAPAPAERLERLRSLVVPSVPMPQHWVPVLGPAFAGITTLELPAELTEAPSWIDVCTRLRRIVLSDHAPDAMREDLRRWASAHPPCELVLTPSTEPTGLPAAMNRPVPAPRVTATTLRWQTSYRSPQLPGELIETREERTWLLSTWQIEDVWDWFAQLPPHPNLVCAKGTVTFDGRSAVELTNVGAPCPVDPPERQALDWADQLLSALEALRQGPWGVLGLPQRLDPVQLLFAGDHLSLLHVGDRAPARYGLRASGPRGVAQPRAGSRSPDDRGEGLSARRLRALSLAHGTPGDRRLA